jgi:hypothetical protein
MKTKSLEKIIFALTIFALICSQSVAQKSPVKFGTVTKADLEMTAYPSDTSASAAVLCNFGYFSASSFDFIRILRIKIFKKEGTDWGNRVFPTSNKTDIRGITYNLVNGEIVETKLKNESIFLERVSEDNYRTRVAMPNVKEGSIIDLEFRFPWLPSEWKFQDVIPVKWSELIIDNSKYIDFRKNYFGFVPLNESSGTRSVAKDVPAFKEEPYMANTSNYMTKYEIEVLRISIPATSSDPGFYREYSTTWDAVNTRLLSSSDFGMAMKGCAFLNDEVDEIEKTCTTPMEKLIAADEFVKHSVKWNENEALYISSENLSTPFNKKIGNSADVNLILIQLLKKLDLNVCPVALSTRSNGFLSPLFPSLDKLNYVVAYVVIDDKPYFVDATEEFLPVGMLPERCINLQGRIIDESRSDFVDLIPVKKDKKMIQEELTISPDLVMTGKMTRRSYDYAALSFRNNYAEFNSEDEFLRDAENRYPGFSIINSKISGLDSIYLPISEEYDVKIKNRITSVGDLIYVYPLIFDQLTENPFKSEERHYPVDFITPSEKVFVSKITIPDGWQIVELPKVMTMKLPDNTLNVQYQISSAGNTVFLTYKFNRTKTFYSVEEYADLRAFFSELVKKHAEPIVLKSIQ